MNSSKIIDEGIKMKKSQSLPSETTLVLEVMATHFVVDIQFIKDKII